MRVQVLDTVLVLVDILISLLGMWMMCIVRLGRGRRGRDLLMIFGCVVCGVGGGTRGTFL